MTERECWKKLYDTDWGIVPHYNSNRITQAFARQVMELSKATRSRLYDKKILEGEGK